MKTQSLGYHTDLFFRAFDGQIIDRGNYLVIRTPTNPAFHWGNFLLFSQPPREGDVDVQRDLFAKEIGIPPNIEHQAFGWDSPYGEEGVIQPFLEAGFHLNCSVVLTSSGPSNPTRPSSLMNIRALETEADWEQAVENQVACREPEF